MKRFLTVMVPAALCICLFSAVANQFEQTWSDWRYIFQSLWELVLFAWGFHLYRESKYKHGVLDVSFIAMIGFCSVNAIHSLYGLCIWIFSSESIANIMARSFEEYNPFFCLFAIITSMVVAFLYLLNLPSILHDK